MNNKIISFEANSYDKHFLDFFNENEIMNKIGEIHSIYKRTINFIDNENLMYTIALKNIDNSPFTLRINGEDINFEDLNFRKGNLLFKTKDKIFIEDKVEINLNEKSLLWTSCRDKVKIVNKKIIYDNLLYLNDLILEKSSNGGCKYFYLKNYSKDKKYKPSLIEKELSKRIERLLDNIESKVIEEKEINSLIGFGIGLTPSGDDFLTGVLSTFNIISTDYTNKIKKKITELIIIDEISTTDVSRQMLFITLKGEMREYISKFIFSLLNEDKDQILFSFENLLNIGSSSGTDLSVGVMTAFSLLINNFNMEGMNYAKYND